MDTTLFIKKIGGHTLLIQFLFYYIIFGSTNESICSEFLNIMQGEFEMSMMGKLNFFLGSQIKQIKNGISINQNSTKSF